MASLRDIRSRIGTVKNTQQITRAMKMVAAAKLRKAQERIFAARTIFHCFLLLAGLAGVPTGAYIATKRRYVRTK